MSIQIKCPSCSRRFEVGEEFEGKTVECGSCDTRFKIDETTKVRSKARVYPGENKSKLLDRIARSPVHEEAPVAFQTASYDPNVNTDAFLPASGGQKAATLVGLGALSLTAFLFFLGSSPGGMLKDVDLTRRLVLGGFVSLLGASFLIYGAKNWRIRGVVLSLALVGAIFALIFLRPVYKTPSGGGSESEFIFSTGKETEEAPAIQEDATEVLKSKVGYAPVEREIEDSGDPEGVVGFYVYPYEESYKTVLLNYFRIKLQLNKLQIPGTYDRDDGRALLIVYRDLPLTFGILEEKASALGKITSHEEARILEIKLKQSHFEAPTAAFFSKLTDPTQPGFSLANLNELKHIDVFRAKQAVDRIDSLPPTTQLTYKPEIIGELLRLFLENSEDSEMLENIGNALSIWATGDKKVADELGDIILSRSTDDLPSSVVDFLLEAKAPQVPQLIDLLWSKNPLNWSNQYEALGSAAEDRLLYHFRSSPLALKKAAAELLRVVGTKKSLPALRSARGNSDPDFNITLNRAIEGIRRR